MTKHPVRVSQRLKLAVLQARCNGIRQHAIARQANLHPAVVSALLTDTRPIHDQDERVIAIGAAVGLKPEDCFSDERSRS